MNAARISITCGLGSLLLVGMLAPSLAPARAQNTAAQDILNFTEDTAVAGGLKAEKGAPDKEIYDVVANVINVILGLVGIIFFIQIFWSGTRWMTSGGNEQAIEEAKSTIKHSIIGVVITLVAFGITNFIFNQVVGVATG